MTQSPKLILLALGLMLGLFSLGFVLDGPGEPPAILFAIPVAIVALAGGMYQGVLGGLLAFLLYLSAGRIHDDTLPLANELSRGVGLLFVGAVVGALAEQLKRRELEELKAEQLRRHAVELNDTVVQGLTVARYQLAGGQMAEAAAAVEATLEQAKDIVAELLADADVEPGSLRRERPAG